MQKAKRTKIRRGSDNVFADLGIANAKDELIKADLIVEIARTIHAKGLGQSRAADILGLTQPQVSNLLRGKTYGFSTDRLFDLLTKLGHNVKVCIEKPRSVPGRVRLVAYA